MKKLLVVAFLLLSFSVNAAFAAEEYKVQSNWASAHQLSRSWWEQLCKDVNAKFGDRVVFHYFPSNTYVKADASPLALRNGVLDICGVSLTSAFAITPHSQTLGLPFIVQNAEEGSILFTKMYETMPEVKNELDKNYKIFSLLTTDRFAFASVNVLIKTPADLKGKRVIVWSPTQVEEVKAWGGMPVQILSNETYMGLQRGLGEVAFIPAPAVETTKIFEVAKHVTLLPSRVMPMLIAANWDSWKSFPKDVQEYLDDVAGKGGLHMGRELVRITNTDMVKLAEKGCTIYELNDEEQQLFKDTAAAVNEKYWLDTLKRNGVKNPQAFIDRVEKLAAEMFNR